MAPDSPFYRALASAADLVIINLLTLVGCIPIVTAGASLAACTRVTMEMAREEDSYVVRSWWKFFRNNLKQSLLWWLPVAALLALGFLEFFLLGSFAGGVTANVLSGMALAGSVILLGVLSWFLPLFAFFDNTVAKHAVNAALLALGRLGYTVGNVVILALPIVLFVVLPGTRTILLWGWVIIGVAFLSYLQALLMLKPINKLRDEAL